MFGFGLLSWLTFLPLVGAALILLVPGDSEAGKNNIRWIALWTTLVVFALSLYAWSKFVPGVADFQVVEQKSWFGSGLTYKLGVDGVSFPFVVLTAFLMPFCI
ncbi:MAG: NADH-quinone oxidoreductase subunit M, partial [Devosia sp.]|nr:NADH-quinone oxidoreductase subunit M [Devosia sp.]